MPKRKAQDIINKYQEKIKKLQEVERKRIRVIYSSSSDSEKENESGDDPLVEDIVRPENNTEEPTQPAQEQLNEVPVGEQIDGSPEVVEIPALDPEMVSALGDLTDESPEFGVNIHENLAKLWMPLLKKGMPKDTKEKLLKEYLIPENCRLLQAPKLNEEIFAAVPEMVRNRDKNLTASQQQLGAGITAINRAMHILLQSDDKLQATKHLSNSCRILCDLHAGSTQSRIKLITPSLDRTFLHIIQDAERDDTVFGKKLSDKIKAAKAIEKQGLQIKKVTVPKTSTATQPTSARPFYSGNWSAPPRYPSSRGRRGDTRRQTTAPSTRRPYNAPPTNRIANQYKPRAPPQ